MKIWLNIILVLFTVSFISCGNSEETSKPKSPETTAVKKKNPRATKKKNIGKYYVNLQNSLTLSNIQVKKLKSINDRYAGKLKNESNKKKKQQLNWYKQGEIKALLGEKLYQRKVAFDKKIR